MTGATLVLAAHPDDEVLGCGGTIARMADKGVRVHIAILADGVGARASDARPDPAELGRRRGAAERSAEILRATSIEFDDLPDNRMDSVPLLEITKRVEGLIARYRPDTVLTHHGGDLNIDHRRVHQATLTACRPQGDHPVRTILCFEVPSSTEWQAPGSHIPFAPNWFVDISLTLERKLAALDAYASELRAWPHPRSRQAVAHLARWRGASIGSEAAEAFMLARHLQ
jgi:LmbE family N-acetylglucosaminyl deacetylase